MASCSSSPIGRRCSPKSGSTQSRTTNARLSAMIPATGCSSSNAACSPKRPATASTATMRMTLSAQTSAPPASSHAILSRKGPRTSQSAATPTTRNPTRLLTPEHALATLTTKSAPSCSITYLFISRSRHGRRQVRQRCDVGHRRRGRIRECVERVLERSQIWQRPGEQEEHQRKREWNERPRPEEKDDCSRREQRERQEIEPHRPEVLRPQHRACADDQQRGQEEDRREQEVEPTEPKRRHMTMAQARPEEQGRRQRRHRTRCASGVSWRQSLASVPSEK